MATDAAEGNTMDVSEEQMLRMVNALRQGFYPSELQFLKVKTQSWSESSRIKLSCLLNELPNADELIRGIALPPPVIDSSSAAAAEAPATECPAEGVEGPIQTELDTRSKKYKDPERQPCVEKEEALEAENRALKEELRQQLASNRDGREAFRQELACKDLSAAETKLQMQSEIEQWRKRSEDLAVGLERALSGLQRESQRLSTERHLHAEECSRIRSSCELEKDRLLEELHEKSRVIEDSRSHWEIEHAAKNQHHETLQRQLVECRGHLEHKIQQLSEEGRMLASKTIELDALRNTLADERTKAQCTLEEQVSHIQVEQSSRRELVKQFEREIEHARTELQQEARRGMEGKQRYMEEVERLRASWQQERTNLDEKLLEHGRRFKDQQSNFEAEHAQQKQHAHMLQAQLDQAAVDFEQKKIEWSDECSSFAARLAEAEVSLECEQTASSHALAKKQRLMDEEHSQFRAQYEHVLQNSNELQQRLDRVDATCKDAVRELSEEHAQHTKQTGFLQACIVERSEALQELEARFRVECSSHTQETQALQLRAEALEAELELQASSMLEVRCGLSEQLETSRAAEHSLSSEVAELLEYKSNAESREQEFMVELDELRAARYASRQTSLPRKLELACGGMAARRAHGMSSRRPSSRPLTAQSLRPLRGTCADRQQHGDWDDPDEFRRRVIESPFLSLVRKRPEDYQTAGVYAQRT